MLVSPTQFCIVNTYIAFNIVNNLEMVNCTQKGTHTLQADPVLIYKGTWASTSFGYVRSWKKSLMDKGWLCTICSSLSGALLLLIVCPEISYADILLKNVCWLPSTESYRASKPCGFTCSYNIFDILSFKKIISDIIVWAPISVYAYMCKCGCVLCVLIIFYCCLWRFIHVQI